MDESLEDLVRRVDEDRWLTSRFAPKPTRDALTAIYALNYEIARTAEAVTDETLGDIRLAWWRGAIQEIHAGGPARHPALEAYAAAGPRPEMLVVWERLIDAREADLAEAPFSGWPDLQTYVEATAGGVFKLAILACLAPEAALPRQLDVFAAKAGQAWGYAGIIRALPFRLAQRRTFLPLKLLAHLNIPLETAFGGVSTHALRSGAMAVIDRARHAYGEARELASVLPAIAFPAYGYLSLTKRYLRELSAPESEPGAVAPTPLLLRQITLIGASALGRV